MRFFKMLGGIIIALLFVVSLLLLRVEIEPVSWIPAPDAFLTGAFTPNDKLTKATRIAVDGYGPEDITRGPDGAFYFGVEDGRVLRMDASGAITTYATLEGGRALGMQFDDVGNLIIADGYLGLISVSADGKTSVLSDSYKGERMVMVDDLDITADGIIWFSDASKHYGYGEYLYQFLEMRPTGRLYSYDPRTGGTTLRLDGIQFANGVAFGPDEAYVLVNETTTGRIKRLWLKGDKVGTVDLFFDGMPGGGDNISYNGDGLFWIAIPALRSAELEAMADKPFLRKLLAILPVDTMVPERLYSFVVAIDTEGNVQHTLQDPAAVFQSITSVNQFGDMLYIGSLEEPALLIIPAP